MSRFKREKMRIVVVFGLLLLLVALASFSATWAAAGQSITPSDATQNSVDAPSAEHPIYLPLIQRQTCTGTVPCRFGDAR